MINISDADKNLWRSGNTKKEVVITFPNLNLTLDNGDIVYESFKLKESIESETNLTFQGCIASTFKIKIINFVQDVRNQNIEVSISTGNSVLVPVFKGYVKEQSNSTHEDISTELTCYDHLKKALEADVTSWYNSLTFPISIKDMRTSFFQRVNIPQETTILTNDNLMVERKTITESVTGREIIRGICQLNGVFGQYGRDGIFHYRKLNALIENLYPDETIYPQDDLYPRESNASEQVYKAVYNKISYQPYHTALVSRVVIVNENGNISGMAGNTTNDTFYIQDNKIAWGVNPNEACQNILNTIRNISFTPAEIWAKGLPYLECGDIIVSNTALNVVQSYITTRTLEGIQDLMDTFESDSTQHRKAYKLSLETEVSANKASAETAQETANTAQETANTAQDSADSAYGYADSAYGYAGSAYNVGTEANGRGKDAQQRLGVIEADYVKTASITALNGRIDTLSSQIITVGDVTSSQEFANAIDNNAKVSGAMQKSTYIQGGYIKTSYLDVNYIKGQVINSNSFSGIGVNVSAVYASGEIKCQRLAVNGTYYSGHRYRFQTSDGYHWLTVLAYA